VAFVENKNRGDAMHVFKRLKSKRHAPKEASISDTFQIQK
jgi:hypothetical protein